MSQAQPTNEGQNMSDKIRRMLELKQIETNGQLTRDESKELAKLRSLTPAELHRQESA